MPPPLSATGPDRSGVAPLVDEAIIEVRSGRGGNGAATFRREKFVPLGGPDGGNGGKGGDVVIVADPRVRTLLDLQRHPHWRGQEGVNGQCGRKSGRNGADCVIRVPVGTLLHDVGTGCLLVDLKQERDSCVVLQGGRGGRGNAGFASATRRTPRFAELGEPGQHRSIRLELKLLADVGIIGFPNAGKSTIVSRISAAKPKIGDYPFTTLAPNLGAVVVDHATSFIVADIPGIIEGAHAGKGLGHQFLRHVERTTVLVHLLDFASSERKGPLEDFDRLNRELALFNEALSLKPQVVVANKIDVSEAREMCQELQPVFASRGVDLLPLSAVSGEGVERLLREVVAYLRTDGRVDAKAMSEPQRTIAPRPTERPTKIDVSFDLGYVVTGSVVEKLVAMTDLENPDALNHLQRTLDGMGIMKMLKSAGIRDGDFVRIGNFVSNFVDEDGDGETP